MPLTATAPHPLELAPQQGRFPQQNRAFAKVASGSLLRGLLGFPAVVVAGLAALILAAIPRSMADPDIWWHLRNAELICKQRTFLTADLFSFTAHGAPWIDHEWLAELPFYLGWRTAGANGVFCVTALVVEAIFLGVFWLSFRASRSLGTASLVTVAAAFLSTVSFGPRTLLFGWLCLVAELILLELARTRPNLVLALPPLFALWINLHGSWMIGLVVFSLVAVAAHLRLPGHVFPQPAPSPRHTRALLLAAAGIVPALFCNPYGWRLVLYPFDLAFQQKLNVANVQEWHSLDLHSLRGEVVLVAIGLLVGRQLWRPRPWELSELALLCVGLYSAFNYTRFLFLLALLGAPILARGFARTQREPSSPATPHPLPVSLPPASLLPASLLHATLLLAVAALTWTGLRRPHPDAGMKQFPVAALPALAAIHPHGRVFNEFLWGGYMEWYLRDTPVFIDSRVDLFERNGSFADYLSIIHIDNSLALLDRYRIDFVFFETRTPLVYLLQHSGGWKVDFQDADTILLERTH